MPAQLHHALIDWNVFSKTKMEEMRAEFGHLSRLWFIDLILAMSQATSGAVTRTLALEMAKTIEVKEPERLLEWAVENGIFIKSKDGRISNERVLQDKERLQAKRDKANKRQKKKRDNSVTEGCFPVSVSVTDPVVVSDLKETVILPDSTAPDVLEAVTRWGKHLETKRKKFGQLEAEALISLYSGRVSELPRDINHSISSGYRAVYSAPAAAEKPRTINAPQAKPEPRSNVPSAKTSDAILREMKAGASNKPLSEILGPEVKAKLEKFKGVA